MILYQLCIEVWSDIGQPLTESQKVQECCSRSQSAAIISAVRAVSSLCLSSKEVMVLLLSDALQDFVHGDVVCYPSKLIHLLCLLPTVSNI
jgi:hypothetical protein